METVLLGYFGYSQKRSINILFENCPLIKRETSFNQAGKGIGIPFCHNFADFYVFAL